MHDPKKAKLPINGLKLNGPLAALWVRASDSVPDPLSYFCRLLDRNCVNIVYMTTADPQAPGQGLCCIDRKAADKVAALLDGDSQITDHVQFGHDVGLITFYPHRWSFTALGLVLQILGEHGIGVHGLASSIAALSFVVDFHQLETAKILLTEQFQLPENSTPPWSTIKAKQE